jgi:hypothetical protein
MMMGEQYMNGAVGQQQQQPYPETPGAQPLVTINQINLTAAQIWSLGAAVVGAIMSMYAGGYLFLPAKESELKEVTKIVEVLKEDTGSNRMAIERLTIAVDNLSGIVAVMAQKQNEPVAVEPPAPRVVPIPRPVKRP